MSMTAASDGALVRGSAVFRADARSGSTLRRKAGAELGAGHWPWFSQDDGSVPEWGSRITVHSSAPRGREERGGRGAAGRLDDLTMARVRRWRRYAVSSLAGAGFEAECSGGSVIWRQSFVSIWEARIGRRGLAMAIVSSTGECCSGRLEAHFSSPKQNALPAPAGTSARPPGP